MGCSEAQPVTGCSLPRGAECGHGRNLRPHLEHSPFLSGHGQKCFRHSEILQTVLNPLLSPQSASLLSSYAGGQGSKSILLFFFWLPNRGRTRGRTDSSLGTDSPTQRDPSSFASAAAWQGIAGFMLCMSSSARWLQACRLPLCPASLPR